MNKREITSKEASRLLDTLFRVADKNAAKEELNHVLADGKYLVATDSYKMLLIENLVELAGEHPYGKALILRDTDYFRAEALVLGHAANISAAKGFPDYERVLTKEEPDNLLFESNTDLISTLYRATKETGLLPDYVRDANLYKALDKVLKPFEVYVRKDDDRSPIMVTGLYKPLGLRAKFITMPLVF